MPPCDCADTLAAHVTGEAAGAATRRHHRAARHRCAHVCVWWCFMHLDRRVVSVLESHSSGVSSMCAAPMEAPIRLSRALTGRGACCCGLRILAGVAAGARPARDRCAAGPRAAGHTDAIADATSTVRPTRAKALESSGRGGRRCARRYREGCGPTGSAIGKRAGSSRPTRPAAVRTSYSSSTGAGVGILYCWLAAGARARSHERKAKGVGPIQ
jgi:hypothetical protein